MILSHTPPCSCKSKEKEKEKKRNINNNLAVLPSHDKLRIRWYKAYQMLSSVENSFAV